MYSTPNLKVTSALVKRNVGTPTPMRGPGAVPGLFALESAVDELAIKLKMHPVQVRLWLDTLTGEEKNKPFSSRHLKECLQLGAEKFGWSKRTPEVGSMRKGDLVLGWGVAAASWGATRGVYAAMKVVLSVAAGTKGTPFQGKERGSLAFGAGRVHAKDQAPSSGVPYEQVLRLANLASANGEGKSGGWARTRSRRIFLRTRLAPSLWRSSGTLGSHVFA